jgi:hypothetical protein
VSTPRPTGPGVGRPRAARSRFAARWLRLHVEPPVPPPAEPEESPSRPPLPPGTPYPGEPVKDPPAGPPDQPAEPPAPIVGLA